MEILSAMALTYLILAIIAIVLAAIIDVIRRVLRWVSK